MFTIIIEPNNVCNSLLVFNGGKKLIEELPHKLRKQTMKMLYILRNCHIIEVGFDGKATHLKTKYFVDYTHHVPLLKYWQLYIGIAQLLDWYLEAHFRTSGNEILCCTCGKTQIAEYLGEQCQSVPCPSHEKWEMVIEGFITPKKMIEEALRSGMDFS